MPPTNRTINSTKTEHVSDHNIVHAFVNDHNGDAAAHAAAFSAHPSLLSVVSYDPGSFTVKTATSSIVNLDTTNLIASFIVPASGKVLVRFTALVNPESGANYFWYVRNAADTVLGKAMVVSGSGDYFRIATAFYLTGLTPGALTVRWAHSQAVGASTTNYGDIGGGNAATIEVLAAP